MLKHINELLIQKGYDALNQAIEHLDGFWADYDVIATSDDKKQAIIMYLTEIDKVKKEGIYLFYNATYDERSEQYYCSPDTGLIGFDYWSPKKKLSYNEYLSFKSNYEKTIELALEECKEAMYWHIANNDIRSTDFLPEDSSDAYYLFDKFIHICNVHEIDDISADEIIERTLEYASDQVEEYVAKMNAWDQAQEKRDEFVSSIVRHKSSKSSKSSKSNLN